MLSLLTTWEEAPFRTAAEHCTRRSIPSPEAAAGHSNIPTRANPRTTTHSNRSRPRRSPRSSLPTCTARTLSKATMACTAIPTSSHTWATTTARTASCLRRTAIRNINNNTTTTSSTCPCSHGTLAPLSLTTNYLSLLLSILLTRRHLRWPQSSLLMSFLSHPSFLLRSRLRQPSIPPRRSLRCLPLHSPPRHPWNSHRQPHSPTMESRPQTPTTSILNSQSTGSPRQILNKMCLSLHIDQCRQALGLR